MLVCLKYLPCMLLPETCLDNSCNNQCVQCNPMQRIWQEDLSTWNAAKAASSWIKYLSFSGMSWHLIGVQALILGKVKLKGGNDDEGMCDRAIANTCNTFLSRKGARNHGQGHWASCTVAGQKPPSPPLSASQNCPKCSSSYFFFLGLMPCKLMICSGL